MDNDEKLSSADNISTDAIAEYYKNMVSEKAETTPQKQKYKFDFNIEDTLNEEIYDFDKNKEQNTLLFCSACVFVASLLLYGAFIFGTSHTVDTENTELTAEKFRRTDINYISAEKENTSLKKELNELNILSAQSKENSVNLADYEATKKKLKVRLDDAKQKYQKVNDELYEVNQKLLQYKDTQKSITLPPGVYIVGTNIAEGTYDVTGKGSILGSTTANEAVINTQLSDTKAEKITLKSGYTIKLGNNTTFNITE